MPVRSVGQRGPKGKKAVAFAVDWPGWSRGAKTSDLALGVLESYRERYRPVAVAAGMGEELDAAGPLDIVEDHVSTGSTDFWGISFAASGIEHEPMDDAELDRKIRLLQACWEFFDAVAARASAERRRGQSDAIVEPAIPHPPQCVPLAGPRLGNAGQGSHRPLDPR